MLTPNHAHGQQAMADLAALSAGMSLSDETAYAPENASFSKFAFARDHERSVLDEEGEAPADDVASGEVYLQTKSYTL